MVSVHLALYPTHGPSDAAKNDIVVGYNAQHGETVFSRSWRVPLHIEQSNLPLTGCARRMTAPQTYPQVSGIHWDEKQHRIPDAAKVPDKLGRL